MRNCGIMARAALAVLLGRAAGAPGRDIPVHREYTRPIFFYDERGERMAFDDAAPDLMALQSLRDIRAQEGLMGKETLLELTFGPGESVFSAKAPLSPAAAAAGSEPGPRRRKKDDSERNWLVKSLTLPNLGQESVNAAKSAMSAGAKESGWGWLADEVSAQAGLAAALPEGLLPEGDGQPMTAQEMALAGGVKSAEAARASSRGEGSSKESVTAASFPARTDAPSDRAAERAEAPARDLPGGPRAAAATVQSYRSAAPVAEMSQTRQMIAELSADVRSDLAALKAPLRGDGAKPGEGADRAGASRAVPDFSSRAGAGSAWAGSGGRLSAGSGLTPGGASGASSWQGGWQAQSAGASGWARFGTRSDPSPASAAPSAPRGSSRPGVSSGTASAGIGVF